MHTLNELRQELGDYPLDAGRRDEIPGLQCCRLALQALEEGNYGIGALLFDNNGNVLAEAGNRVFSSPFNSAGHAEMLVIDHFEEKYPSYPDRKNLTMMVSLEPCPMCLTRMLIAGIGRVIYLAEDSDGGMARLLGKMPPAWQNLAELQDIGRADISPVLTKLATKLAAANIAELRRKLIRKIRG